MSTIAPLTTLSRSVVVGLALVVAVAASLGIGATTRAASEVKIQTVTVDLSANELTIIGSGFDNPQDTTVLFGGSILAITSETSTSIVATLPGTVTAGLAYEVEVIVTSGSSRSDEFDVTIPNDAALEAEIDALQVEGAALDTRIAALETLLAGATRGTDGNTGVDTLVLSGANLQVVNGTGSTDGSPNGAGNVIIGYNTTFGLPKTGSHFLIVGDDHGYTTSSGIVAGNANSVTGQYGAAVGGQFNHVSGDFSAIVGGIDNLVSGIRGFIGGGNGNVASGQSSFVGGGDDNAASGDLSSTVGGSGLAAEGDRSFIGGGTSQTAPTECAWVANSNINC
jgi:hypothetical protein